MAGAVSPSADIGDGGYHSTRRGSAGSSGSSGSSGSANDGGGAAIGGVHFVGEATPVSEDDRLLASLGYKQELHRGFSSFMSFAFCFTSVAVLSSISLAWPSSMSSGGPSVLIWGWVICGSFTMLSGLAMAEICSTYPSAGSVYHWAAMLAPRRFSALSCYVCGVFNLLGNAAGDASYGWGFAAVVATAINYRTVDQAGNPTGPVMSPNKLVGISIAVCLTWSIINALRVDQQGWVNNFAAIWQVTTTIAIIIAVITIPGRDPDVPLGWVWHTPFNLTGIPDANFGYVCLIGLLSALFAFSGYEAGAHMAEETTNSAVASPWGIVATCALVFSCGFAYIVGLLYATPSVLGMRYKDWVPFALNGWTPVGNPVTKWLYYNTTSGAVLDTFALIGVPPQWEYLNTTTDAYENPNDDGYYTSYYAANSYAFTPPWTVDTSVQGFLKAAMTSVAGGSSVATLYFSACGWSSGMALTVVLIINLFFAGISSLTVTSRIAFAMVRDGAFPGSSQLRIVWPLTKSPIYTIMLVFVFDSLLLLLPLATTVALNAVLSITVIGYQISYAIPILLRVTTGRATFKQGPFNLGTWSEPIHWAAGIWLVLTSLIFFLPPKWPVVVSGINGGTAATDNMNYTVVIVGVAFIVSLVYWMLYARHDFQGPRARGEDAAAKALADATPVVLGGDSVEAAPEKIIELGSNLDSPVQRATFAPTHYST